MTQCQLRFIALQCQLRQKIMGRPGGTIQFQGALKILARFLIAFFFQVQPASLQVQIGLIGMMVNVVIQIFDLVMHQTMRGQPQRQQHQHNQQSYPHTVAPQFAYLNKTRKSRANTCFARPDGDQPY